jgi:hypothetical protein
MRWLGLDENGVTYRIDFTGSASDFLRGDGTWGPDPGDWKLLGNAGTDPSVNYLGTADATQFHIRTNNTERMRFFVDGRILIGTTTPLSDPSCPSSAGGQYESGYLWLQSLFQWDECSLRDSHDRGSESRRCSGTSYFIHRRRAGGYGGGVRTLSTTTWGQELQAQVRTMASLPMQKIPRAIGPLAALKPQVTPVLFALSSLPS